MLVSVNMSEKSTEVAADRPLAEEIASAHSY